jgi:phage tail tape-measure protein
VEGSVFAGAQTGSILGGLLTIASGPFMIVGLTVGALLGGWGGMEAGEAIDARWKYYCNDCGNTWRQLE